MYDHRSLRAWKAANVVSLASFLLARDHWVPWASAVFSQLQRAALSVQLNIAEGWSFGPSPNYNRHLGIAFGSAVETAELLELAKELGLAPPIRLEPIQESNRLSRQLLLGLLRRRRPF
ncbi:MAG: four helix bundle protein [Gemmatimonadetes bacterium]|nr:four helix bundle protein [Gemmatimonadota bacterium]